MSFYVTTPIYYVNAEPHLGHVYTTVVADTVARFQRLKGEEVFFLTGTDEHGDKIVQAAQKAGLSPQDYVEHMSKTFQDTWPVMNISYSRFIRTTDPAHKRVVQFVLQKIYDNGDIYFDEYEGLYCFGCERFLTEKELKDGLCPDHMTPPTPLKEANYFFRLSRYQDWLIDYIKRNSDLITPQRYRNEILAFLSETLEDLCISRPKTRLTWGIDLPFDNRFVTYVWFDALLNYLSGIGYPDNPRWKRIWPAHHIIAKDILKPHAVYWPIMLKALGVPIYRQLHVHGYWNVGQAKMSKSLGNIVRPSYLVQNYGVDQVRYFLLREMAFGLDANFSEDSLIQRINAELANDLGNLVFRSLTMVAKYFDGYVPDCHYPEEQDRTIWALAEKTVALYKKEMEGFQFHRALAALWKLIREANRYVDHQAPWSLMKTGQTDRAATVLYYLLEVLRVVGVCLWPVCPRSSERILRNLGFEPAEALDLKKVAQFGLLPSGRKTSRGKALFPRIEPHIQEDKAYISFEEFQKIDLRVAEIIAAEKVPKTDRLIKLTVRCPEERTVVAGIGEYYRPEELVGKQVVFVANLKPTTIRGIVSEGMLLVAKGQRDLGLIVPEKASKPGDKIA